jgi:tetratricopeptide (TPR) repeat protein
MQSSTPSRNALKPNRQFHPPRGAAQLRCWALMKNFIAVIAVIAVCFALPALAQHPEARELTFNQAVSDCENRWFGAEAQDGSVILGYVYIDPDAGFTFEHYGTLEEDGGLLRAVQSNLSREARLIHRIGRNFPATCLVDDQVTALGLPLVPETMQFYKDSRPLGEHHAAWAYHYNHIGASDKALGHVLKAQEVGANSAALTFEHAFALNALEMFDATVRLLDPVYLVGGMTGDLIAELAYARLGQGDYQRAIELYTQAIDPDQGEVSSRRWEFARNIAAAYEKLGDGRQRDVWIERAEKYRTDRE